MSTRWYPLYQRGNPQLRVFLPNFWMKLIKPEIRLPPNVVQFHVSPQMTEHDVKNYLRKIYNVPVVHVRTEILMGSLGFGEVGGLSKKDDIRLATVTMRRDTHFTFPDVIQEKVREKEREDMTSDLDKVGEKFISKNDDSGWFSI